MRAADPARSKADCPDCRRHRLALVVAFAAAFGSGCWTSSLLHRERVRAEGERRFGEFLVVADSLGIIDHARLDELASGQGDEGTNAP